MDIEPAVLMIIMLVAIGLAIGLIYTAGQGSLGSPLEKIKQVFRNASQSINPGSSYDICADYNNKRISQKDFETLLQSMYRGNCRINSTTIQLSFSLKKEDFNKLLDGMEIGDNGSKVFYRYDMDSLGIGAVIVKGNAGTYPLKMYDKVELSFRGSPDKDIVIQLKEEGCDPYDQNCESMCSYMEEICDPLCYQNGQAENAPCDIDCVDADRDGNITGIDQDGICDLDCYNKNYDPQRAYDPDCVAKNKDIFDGICDPDSNGVMDGICDPDCAMNKTICDPDCNGLEYDGNPKALLSATCYICDRTCNGFCSMSCKKEDNDTDCLGGFHGFNNLTECCGNGKCSTDDGEDCKNCNKDCPAQGITCEDLGKVCCPAAAVDIREYGCAEKKNLSEGSSCTCSGQCASGLLCESDGHCCPKGENWDSKNNACGAKYSFYLLFLQVNGNIPDFEQKAQKAADMWTSISPLSECPERVKVIALSGKVCSAPSQQSYCSNPSVGLQTLQALGACEKNWPELSQYRNLITRVIGVSPGPYICTFGSGAVFGYTDLGGKYMMSCEGDIQATATHEMGHTFGLCDEGYGGKYCSGCASGWCTRGGISCGVGIDCCPNKPEDNSIMCSKDLCGTGCSEAMAFAPTSYSHLKTVLNKYCQ